MHWSVVTSKNKTIIIFFFFVFFFFRATIIYFVATAVDGAAAPAFLGLGCVPSRNPFLKDKKCFFCQDIKKILLNPFTLVFRPMFPIIYFCFQKVRQTFMYFLFVCIEV